MMFGCSMDARIRTSFSAFSFSFSFSLQSLTYSEKICGYGDAVKKVLPTFFRAYSMLSVRLRTLNTSEKAPVPKGVLIIE